MSINIIATQDYSNNNIYILKNQNPVYSNGNIDIPINTFLIIPKGYELDINVGIVSNYGTIINYGIISIQAFVGFIYGAINNKSTGVLLNEFSGIINNYSSSNSNINSGRFISRGEYNNELGISNFTNNLGGVFKNKMVEHLLMQELYLIYPVPYLRIIIII